MQSFGILQQIAPAVLFPPANWTKAGRNDWKYKKSIVHNSTRIITCTALEKESDITYDPIKLLNYKISIFLSDQCPISAEF